MRDRSFNWAPGLGWVTAFAAIFGSAACSKEPSVVVYCSVDEGFARQVFDVYRKKTGQAVDVVFDSEAGKTTGFVQRIRAEGDRPRADLFWSSEIFNTILLARQGFLAPAPANTAPDIPARFRDSERRWIACALRGRVLAYDPARISDEELPDSWEQLAEPRWASKLAFANPLFGTTRGHVAAVFALWGPERGRAFLEGLRENGAEMVDGNSTAVRRVMGGSAVLAMTDTDDVYSANRQGANLEMRFLDMGDGGTLLIPCTAAVLKGSRNPEKAAALLEFLVSAEVERLLFESPSGNIPVREKLRDELGCVLPPASRISYDAVADSMEAGVDAVREILIR